MALAAAQVVDTVQALLAPVPITGGRVYTSRLWPLSEAELPAGRVFAGDEQISSSTLLDGEEHTLEILVKGYARATADLDDTLNAIASAWLSALFATSPPFNLSLSEIERDLTSEGEASVGVITLHLQAIFETVSGSPETIL